MFERQDATLSAGKESQGPMVGATTRCVIAMNLVIVTTGGGNLTLTRLFT
jgi:hypothetical protein